MKGKYVAFFVFLSLAHASCLVRPNCKRHFTVFEHPIAENNAPVSLKKRGIYISETGNAAFFLYENGKVKIHLGALESYPQKHMRTPEKVLSEMLTEPDFNSKEFWGDYGSSGNKIRIQVFARNNEYLCKRFIYDNAGQEINDSTIEIYFSYSAIGKDTMLNGQTCRLKFYSTKTKPDSTRAWFNNRKWYRRKLHESRKVH